MTQACVLAALVFAAGIILYIQLFIAPIVGLADNNDFRRTIGALGWGPAERNLTWDFVNHNYVRDPSFEAPGYDIFTSEFLFIAPVVGFAEVFRLARIPITAFGYVHCFAFLIVLGRLLYVTRGLRMFLLVWVLAIVMLTDTGYAAYWNSLFSEPASCLFFLWVLAESIEISGARCISPGPTLRWSFAAVLFLTAKPQNAPLGVPLAIFLVLNVTRRGRTEGRALVYAASAFVFVAAILSYLCAQHGPKRDTGYDMVFGLSYRHRAIPLRICNH